MTKFKGSPRDRGSQPRVVTYNFAYFKVLSTKLKGIPF